jgi:hypothetical protein
MIRYHLFIELAILACVKIGSVLNVLQFNVKDNVISLYMTTFIWG